MNGCCGRVRTGHWKPLTHISAQNSATGSPQIFGQGVPQSVRSWPPQSSPCAQTPPTRLAQHGGSGAKQRAFAGQQPEQVSSVAPPSTHCRSQQEPCRIAHWPAAQVGSSAGQSARQRWGGESGHISVGAGRARSGMMSTDEVHAEVSVPKLETAQHHLYAGLEEWQRELLHLRSWSRSFTFTVPSPSRSSPSTPAEPNWPTAQHHLFRGGVAA